MRHKLFAKKPLPVPGIPIAPEGWDGDQSRSEAIIPGSITRSAEGSVLVPAGAVLRSLFSFEALMVLFMFAGMYKEDPRFAWIPVDLTALFFALSVLVGSFIIVVNPISKRAFPVILTMLALVAWWAVTLTWSPSKIYGPTKVFYLSTLVLWGLTAGALIIGPSRERVRRLFTIVLLLSVWVGIESLLIYRVDPALLHVSEGGARASGEYRTFGSYQQIGRMTGLGALIALTVWLFGRHTRLTSLAFLVLSGMLTFVLTLGGGKGPVLATAACILLALVLGLRFTRRKIFYKRYQLWIIWLTLGLVVGLSIYIAAADRTPRSLQRLADMVEGGEFQGTAASRWEAYQDALRIWPEAPLLGHGAGSWPILNGIPDRLSTPHNMFLEVAVETGVVGLVLLTALLVVALRPVSIDRLRNDPLALCALMLFVWAFLKANLGPDITENRAMFMLLGVLTTLMLAKERDQPPHRPPDPAALNRPRLWISRSRDPRASPRERLGPVRTR